MKYLTHVIIKSVRYFFSPIKESVSHNVYARKWSYSLAKKKDLVDRQSCAIKKEVTLTPVGIDKACYVFNPTIINNGVDINVLARIVGAKGERGNVVAILDKNMDVKEVKVAHLGKGDEKEWVADCRAFEYNDKLFVTYNTGHSEVPNRIFLQEVSRDFVKQRPPLLCEKKGVRKSIEKNWGFFEFSGQLYCIYSVSPFIILKTDFSDSSIECTLVECAIHYWNSSNYEERFGELRGGASPFYYKGLYYYVVQSHVENVFGKIYSATIVAFDPNDNFKPVRISSKPIFTLDHREYMTVPRKMLNAKVESCLYPTGAVMREDNLIVSYGVNDFNANIKSYCIDCILSHLDSEVKVA